jgi:LPS sulfotransferase NodH
MSQLSRTAEGSRERQGICVARSRILDLYGAEYDFNEQAGSPRAEYMLATLPRSGSTYLALELWRTGVMGAPMEYPNPMFARVMRARLRLADPSDAVEFWKVAQRLRTSPNGVFGYKMFSSSYQWWAHNSPAMLPLIAPAKVVFLTRSSVIEQAVSYSKAIRSGSWFHDVPARKHSEYDAEHIEICVGFVEYQLEFWKELFALTGAQVHHVTYESLLGDRLNVIKEIADFLGVERDRAAALDLPRIEVQRNTESIEWARRYRGEHADPAPTITAYARSG